jgi:hypothetical protein
MLNRVKPSVISTKTGNGRLVSDWSWRSVPLRLANRERVDGLGPRSDWLPEIDTVERPC